MRDSLLFATICTLGILPYTAHAGLEEGIDAYNRQDYSDALSEFRSLAKTGDVQAQLLLGLMHDNGLGTTQDYAQAFHWYREAAERGNPRAQFNVAEMLAMGQGTRQDKTAAMGWYRRAAENGFAEAQYRLGLALSRGETVEQDLVEAFKWLDLSAAQQIQGSEAALMALEQLKLKMTPQQVLEGQERSTRWRELFDRREQAPAQKI